MSETVQTVLGKIDPETLGRTLTHEHMALDYTQYYVKPPKELEKYFVGGIHLKNVGFVQRYPYSSLSNVSFFSQDAKAAVLNDVTAYKEAGGGAIVENTNHGLKRDLSLMQAVSEVTGIHVIAGTGYYLASVQPQNVLNKTVEEISDVIFQDMAVGCPDLPSVKTGFIGEVASDYPINPFEAKVIEATGIIQSRLSCPVSFHPGRAPEAPSEIMRRYTEAGGDPKRAVMSHLDRTLPTVEDILEFASEYPCYLQHDLFGTEVLTYQFAPGVEMPSDGQRVERIKSLVDEGHVERLLLSHDVHTKHRLLHFGGHGYMHLYANVVPKMLLKGISQNAIDQITITNPKNWLTWDSS